MKRSQLAGIIAIVCVLGAAMLPWAGYLVAVGIAMLVIAFGLRVLEGRSGS